MVLRRTLWLGGKGDGGKRRAEGGSGVGLAWVWRAPGGCSGRAAVTSDGARASLARRCAGEPGRQTSERGARPDRAPPKNNTGPSACQGRSGGEHAHARASTEGEREGKPAMSRPRVPEVPHVSSNVTAGTITRGSSRAGWEPPDAEGALHLRARAQGRGGAAAAAAAATGRARRACAPFRGRPRACHARPRRDRREPQLAAAAAGADARAVPHVPSVGRDGRRPTGRSAGASRPRTAARGRRPARPSASVSVPAGT